MASDVSGDVLRGLGVPFILTSDHIWSEKATFTEQGPTVGQAEPQGAYTLAIQTAGTQSAAKQLRIRTHRGGHPGADQGAEFIYRYQGDTNFRGHDVQPTSAHQVIRSTAEALTGALKDPDAASFYSTDRTDRICVVYQRQTASPTAYIVEAATYDPSAASWSTATVYTKTASPTDGYHPAIAYNPVDGYLYCCHWIYDDDANLAQIATHRSKDGATWETVSEYALDAGVDISSAVTAYEVSRLRMAFNAGQCLLVAHVISNATGLTHRDQVAQFASTSRGARFSTVEIAQVTISGSAEVFFSNHSVNVVNGVLTVWYPFGSVAAGGVPAIGLLGRVSLPSAFSSISSRSLVLISTANPILSFRDSGATFSPVQYSSGKVTNGDGSVWVSDDGAIYAAHRIPIGELNTVDDAAVFLNLSTDGGDEWKYAGNGDSLETYASDATVINTGDSSTYFSHFSGVSHRGRQVLVGLNVSDVTSVKTLSAVFLGGHSTVTLPGRIVYPAPYQRSGWVLSYLPFELPANISSLTTATTGTASDSIGTDGLLLRSTTSGTNVSHFSPTSTIAQGLIVRYALTVVSGGSLATEAISLRVQSGDSSSTLYTVSVRFSSSGFRMIDVQDSGATIGVDKTSVSPSGGIEVLAALVDGKFSCWFRALNSNSDRQWTSAIQNYSLTNGGGSAANEIRFGCNVSSTVSMKIHELHSMSGLETLGALGAGQTNPDDLRGRTFSRRGRYIGVDDGVRISAVDGSAMANQSWNIDSAADHPISRIFHRESPSPRTQWRSNAVTSGNVAEQLIPFVLNKDATTLGAEEQGLGSTMAYIALKGINWSSGAVQRWDTGSSAWVTVATISNQITTSYSYTRRGSELHPPSLPTTSSGRYLYENECAGWSVRFANGICRKITGNTAGTLASNVSGPKPTFFLDGIDGSEPATTTLTLIPSHVCVMFHTDGETGGGWALKIDAQTTAPYTVDGTAQYDLRLGHLSLGRMFIFGTQYGRGRVVMYESGDLTEDTPGGTRRSVRAGPGGRTVRIAWSDPIDTTQTQGISANPDYITSTTTAGNTAVAAAKDVPFSLLGLLEKVGARDPVAYFPRIERSTGAGDTQTFLRHHTCLIGTIASAGQFESVVGEEDSNTAGEAMRFSTVVIEELR